VSHHRLARVTDRIHRLLAEAIRTELGDPRVVCVTLTGVKLSPDLQHAVAYVIGPGEQKLEASLEALNRAAPLLRRLLASRAGLRHTPALRFARDAALERGFRLEATLAALHAERSARPDEP
jgi:ribosome-binding factor A